jgi:hypothetical protein
MNAVALAEIATTEFASNIINEIAKKRKMSGMTIAPFVPGVTHNHPPCNFVVESCAYCMRNGNVFAKKSSGKESNDIIFKYRSKILLIFEEMKKEITENIDKSISHKNDDGEDLERMLMEELGIWT